MIDKGATTVWERWDGVDDDGVPHESLNHYSKGAVVSFLHRYTAGLVPTSPGYRTFAVRPRPGGGLTRVAQRLETRPGSIDVEWRADHAALRAHRRRARATVRRDRTTERPADAGRRGPSRAGRSSLSRLEEVAHRLHRGERLGQARNVEMAMGDTSDDLQLNVDTTLFERRRRTPLRTGGGRRTRTR